MKSMDWKVINFLFLVAMTLFCSLASSRSFLDREDVREYLDEVSLTHSFSKEYLQSIFLEHEPNSRILALMSKPTEKRLEWYQYKKLLVDEPRIELGLKFWNANQVALDRAERVYGVAPEFIVAIIGIETRYGRVMGSFPVVRALATLAFDFPARADFFRKELTEFLILTRSQKLDPLILKGSYAGAMGYGQFMPSSYRAYAVDFDRDNFKDIWNNKSDAIGSVANYMSEHGWVGEGPVIVRAVRDDSIESGHLAGGSLKPNVLAGELREKGIYSSLPDSDRVALFVMQGEQEKEYWLGLDDFYVITRYNHSSMYALAVYQLSQALRQKRLESPKSLEF